MSALMSIDSESDCATKNFLTINCIQELPKNELSIVSTTKECTLVEDQVMETNSRAAVRRLILILPSLSDAHLRPGTA